MRWAERWARLDGEHDALVARIAGRTGSISAVFDRICDVLLRLGYLAQTDADGGRATLEVTDEGRWLRRIYAENDLLLAECLRRGVFDELDAPGLAAAVSALVYRSRRDDAGEPRIPGGPASRLGVALDATVRAWSELDDLESEHKVETTQPLDTGLVEAVHRWAARAQPGRGAEGQRAVRRRLRAVVQAGHRRARPDLPGGAAGSGPPDRTQGRRRPAPRCGGVLVGLGLYRAEVSSTLYRHGAVHTPADPFAEALLVEDGVVAWVGADDTADGFASRADEIIDLDGALVAPGFVDAHVHVLETGLALESIDLSPAGGVHSLADALAAVHRAAEQRPASAEDSPLLGFGWDEQRWPEGRPPTRQELDAAAGGAPVYLARVDVHSAVVSSAADREFRPRPPSGLELRRAGRARRPPRRARGRPHGRPGAPDPPLPPRVAARGRARCRLRARALRALHRHSCGSGRAARPHRRRRRAACPTSWATAASSA